MVLKNSMSNNKTIAKNTMFLYFRMMLIMGVTLYTSRVILEKLGVEDFGLYSVVGGVVTMFAFLNGSLSGATSRFITYELGKKNYKRLKENFNASLLIHIVIAVLIVFLAETIGLWFLYNKMIIPPQRFDAALWVYQISILTSVFSITQVPFTAVIIAHENMKIYAYVGIVEVLGKLFIAYAISFSPFDKLVFYALLLFVLQITIMLFYRLYCGRKFAECKLKICKDVVLYKQMFSFAGSDMIGSIAVLAQGQGLNLLLNMFFGPVVNAARAIAYQVQGAITQFSQNFMMAVKPQIIKQYAVGNIKEMMTLVELSSCFSFYLLLMISLPICLEVNFILTLWLGSFPAYTEIFIILVIIICLIQALKTPRSSVFHAMGRLKLVNLVVGGILCLAFPLSYFFLKSGYSPHIVFVSAIITLIISELASVIILRKYLVFSILKYFKNVHLRCFFVSILSFFSLFVLRDFIHQGLFRLIYTIFLSILIVGFLSLYLGIDKKIRNRLFVFIKDSIRVWKR